MCRTVNLPQYACHTQCFEGRSMAVPPFSTLAHGQLHICSNHSIATFPPMTTSTTQLHDSPHAVIPLRDATRHALRANFRILSSRESDVTFLPLWLHWDGWSPGFSLLWLSKESSRLAKCECEKRQGLGGMAKLGQRLKQKKQFLPTGKAWIAGRGIITITFIIIFLPPIVLWHKPKHQSTGTPFSCCFFPRWKVETNLSHVETKKQLESHDTNNGNIPPIQNSSRFVATAVSWNEQGCCLCPLSVAVAVAVTMICLLKTLGITAQRRGKPIPLQFVAP